MVTNLYILNSTMSSWTNYLPTLWIINFQKSYPSQKAIILW